MKRSYENQLSTENLTFDSRTHAFSVGIANDFGINVALFLGHLAFWSEKNLANNKHIHDGLVWCYDTLEAMRDYFPYFTKRQVEHMINKCVNAGLVTSGNYNKHGYDRTCWYALTPTAYFYFPHLATEKYLKRLYSTISQKCEMDFTKWGNAFRKNVTPIPDTDPDPTPDECGEAKSSDTHTPKKLSKAKAEEAALNDEKINDLFKEKFSGYEITIDELFKQCQEHYEQKSLWTTKEKFKKWIKRERLENYDKVGSQLPKKRKSPEQIAMETLEEDYRLYRSQFINDRDFLKIPAKQGKEPLSFKDWRAQHDRKTSEKHAV
jgi:hypothetical protein